MSNKYHAVRCWSNLCQRGFDSKAECRRGEELHLLQMAGEITDLQYQIKFVLSEKPRITITIDFSYIELGTNRISIETYEDTKGVLTRDFRTKMAWLKEQRGIDVLLSK